MRYFANKSVAILVFGLSFCFSQISLSASTNVNLDYLSEGQVNELVEEWLNPHETRQLTLFLGEELSISHEVKPQVLWGIVKKALVYALRNHSDTIAKKLPAKWRKPVRKYAGTIANLIDSYDSFKEKVLYQGLMKAGVPKKPAGMIAKAIAFLVG